MSRYAQKVWLNFQHAQKRQLMSRYAQKASAKYLNITKTPDKIVQCTPKRQSTSQQAQDR